MRIIDDLIPGGTTTLAVLLSAGVLFGAYKFHREVVNAEVQLAVRSRDGQWKDELKRRDDENARLQTQMYDTVNDRDRVINETLNVREKQLRETYDARIKALQDTANVRPVSAADAAQCGIPIERLLIGVARTGSAGANKVPDSTPSVGRDAGASGAVEVPKVATQGAKGNH